MNNKLCFIICLLLIGLQTVQSQLTTSLSGGEWTDASYWTGSAPPYNNVNNDVVVNHRIESNLSITYRDGGSNKHSLTVNDTLIVYGDLTLGSFDDVTVGANGVLIIFGDFYAENQVNVGNGGYFVVLGDYYLPSGGTSHTNTGDAKTFVTGTVTVPTGNDLDCDPNVPPCEYGDGSDIFTDPIFDFIDEISDETCSISLSAVISDETSINANDGSINVTITGGSSPSYTWSNDAVTEDITGVTGGSYSLIVMDGTCVIDTVFTVGSNCCGSSNYYSYDNLIGNWEDISSWESPDEAWRPLPPPTDGVSTGFSQPLCVKGTITVNGDLTIRSTTYNVCDTLVVTGNLDVGSFTINIASQAVLIVLGNYTGTSGTADNGGKVVIAGEVDEDYTLGGSGDTYIFDPTPTGNFNGGFTSAGDETDLANSDPDLFNFYQSISCGLSGGTIGSNESICSGDTASEITNITAASPAGSITYAWYLSTDSNDPVTGTWSLVTDSTREALYPGILAQESFYYREATDGGCTANSNVVSVSLYDLPTATITINSLYDSICTGDSPQMNINFLSGASPYNFTITDGTNIESVSNISVNPYTYTPAVLPVWVDDGSVDTDYTYTISTITDSNGCSSTNQGSGQLTVYKKPEVRAVYHIQNN